MVQSEKLIVHSGRQAAVRTPLSEGRGWPEKPEQLPTDFATQPNFESQISNPYLFVGSQGVMEELPGLYFMRARYYSAEVGAFLSTDPVRNLGPDWRPVAYAYVQGNPLGFTDPRGEFVNILAGAALGALVSGGLDVIT
ncbi:MAG: RHS repeat-associated core domain-containing protein, partial [Chloroflexota bacterium]